MKLFTKLIGYSMVLFSIAASIALMAVIAGAALDAAGDSSVGESVAQAASATPTLTPTQDAARSAAQTPTRTLLPPPTFEPATNTPEPSPTPTITPTITFEFDVALEGIRGLETPTPTPTRQCRPREDWGLVYEVKPNDILERIAKQYNVQTWEIAEANCLADANVISIGQTLRVPGGNPNAPKIECTPWEVLTPLNGAYSVDGNGQLTFNWRGPRAPRNLIRVIKPDGGVWERTIDLRQNETINLFEELPAEGNYQWYVYPLDMNFQQINCTAGGPWTFHKTAAGS